MVAAADRPLIPEFCGAALGIPVSWGPQKGKDGGGRRGKREPTSTLTFSPMEACSFLFSHSREVFQTYL